MLNSVSQELIDAIIDIFHSEPWILRSCSLVCHSWLPNSQRHLFRRITLFPPNKRYCRRPGVVPYSKRLDQVLLKSPHIANYIRELKVYEGHIFTEQDWIATDQTLPLVLRKLINLNRIEFRRFDWNTLSLGLRRSICWVLRLPSLTSVEIEGGRFASMDDFASFLYRAQGLNGLSLTDINIIKTSYGSREPLTHEDKEEEEEEWLGLHQQRPLFDLRLALDGYPKFIDWLLGPQSPLEVSHIHTLHMSDFYQSNTSALNQLLHTIGTSLRHFELSAPFTVETSYIDIVNVDITRNSGVKFLHLKQIKMSGTTTRDNDNSLPWLLRFLSNIDTPSQLEEIKLGVCILRCDNGPAYWSAWGEVDSILAGAHFGSLRKLDIDLRSLDIYDSRINDKRPEWSREICEKLVGGLPLLRERGVCLNAD